MTDAAGAGDETTASETDAVDELAEGMHERRREWIVGNGGIDFAWAATALSTGELFRAAGLKPDLAADVFTFHPGLGPARPFSMTVLVADRQVSQNRAALSLVTAPGHALHGEEHFEVTKEPGGDVVLRFEERSRPAPGVWTAVWPAVRAAQAAMQRRYGPAMKAIVEGRPNRNA